MLSPESVVLNLGAGPATNDPRRVLKGEVARVVGADIDPVVLRNDELDEAARIGADGRLPFDDATFDLVLSDFVLEHIEEPKSFMLEVCRVLRPGAWFLFRTPNQWHYVSLIARLTPHWFHRLVANRVRGLPPDAHEPWPTYYRLNTRRTIVRCARAASFRQIDLHWIEGAPAYLMFASLPFLLGVAYERLVNRVPLFRSLRVNILGRLQKAADVS